MPKKLYALDLFDYEEAVNENQKTLDIVSDMVIQVLNHFPMLRIWNVVNNDYQTVKKYINNVYQYNQKNVRNVRGLEVDITDSTASKSYYYTDSYIMSIMFYDIVKHKSVFTLSFDFDFVTTETPIALFYRDIQVHITSDNIISSKFTYDDTILSANFIENLINYIDVTFFDKIKRDTKEAMKDTTKKVIYLAHPYRGSSDTTLEKIRNVSETDNILHKLTVECPDLTVISPVHTFMCLEGLVDGDEILERCFNLLSLADEIWVFGDYKNSKGCLAEIEFAKQHGIKVIIMDIDRFFGF